MKESALLSFTEEEKKKEVEDISFEKLLKEIMITEPPPEEFPALSINETVIATLGNHSLIVGKKKSRKTLFLVWLISQYSGDIENEILFFDTEQGKSHVWLIRQRVYALTGKWVPVFFLRGKSPTERRSVIAKVVKEWKTKPKLVFIDGIRDLLSNINDPDQTTDVITWIESLTLMFNLHLVNILHLNKTDNNARGHLGSELLNKAQGTIELELDSRAGCTIVKCESSRDKPFESFAFTHGDTGLPVVVDAPIRGEIISEDEQKKKLQFLFNDMGDLLTYANLVEGIKINFKVGTSKAKGLIPDFQGKGWIIKNGKTGTRDVVYKLLI